MKSNTYYIVRIIFSFVILMLTVFIFSCTDEDPDGSAYAPELTVGGTNDLGRTSATVSGKFGGKLTRVKEYGVKYSTSSLFPDDQTTRVSFEGNPASGNFSTQLTGLSSNTQYYFCLYATTGATEVTSSMGSFSTVSTSKPSFTDVSLDSIGENTVVVRFRISEVGDEYLVEQGVSYRKKSTAGTEESYIPVTTDSLADATTREYISVLDGLTASTQYEIRPYAKNSSDANGDNGMIEGYGDTQTFTTEAQRSPVVEMYDPNNIGISSVELSGIVTSAPGSNGVLDEIGFCYVEGNKTPTWRDDCVIIDAKDLNTVYTITLTELREETTYSVRMFARNTVDGSARYGYGETKTFTTGGLQTPIFDAFTNISVTAQTITLTANLSTEGYDENNVAERGFYWAVGDYSECTLDKASILGNSLKVTDGGSSFTATISNLRVGEQYYVAAYAIYKSAEKELTGYSDIEPISTSAFTAASLGNVRVSDETYFGATVQGVINSQGNGTITRRGFVVSRDYDKPTRTNCDLDRTADDTFKHTFTELSAGTNYYVRAYAICTLANDSSTVYSDATMLTTVSVESGSLKEVTVESVTYASATVSSGVLSQGDGELTEAGFCWAASADLAGNVNLENAAGSVKLTDLSNLTDQFSAEITGLDYSKEYKVRAYIKTLIEGKLEEVSYSSTANFTTTEPQSASLNTLSYSNVSLHTVDVSVEMSSAGDGTVVERGFCWVNLESISYWNSVTLENKEGSLVVADGDGTETAFQATLTGLNQETQYRVAAYVITELNGVKYTAYSSYRDITTSSPQLPSMNAPTVSDLSYFSASFKLNMYDEGNYTITRKGVVLSSKESEPVINDNEFIQDFAESDSCTVTGLTQNTTYYVRSFAVCSLDGTETTTYSDYRSFSTSSVGAPQFGDLSLSNETLKGFDASTVIRENGDGTVTERGFCWAPTSNLSYYESVTLDNATGSKVVTTDDFSATIDSLAYGTEYRVTAYARYSVGEQYSNITYSNYQDVQTKWPESPSLGSPTCDASYFSAKITFSLTSEGSYTIIRKGVCVSSKISDPTLENNERLVDVKEKNEVEIDSLTLGTTYYVRNFVVAELDGSSQTFYSDNAAFTTLTMSASTFAQLTFSNIGLHTMDVTAGVVTKGDGDVVEKGFCWIPVESIGYWDSPTLETDEVQHAPVSDGTIDSYTSTISGLTASTNYRVVAYAKAKLGDVTKTSYSEYRDVNTSSPQLPSMNAPTVSNLSYFSASFKLNMYDKGNYTITRKGVVLSSDDSDPVINDCEFIQDFADNDSCFVSGLTQNTTYYVRSFAVCNLDGTETTTYSDYRSFRTSSISAPQFGDLSLSNQTLKGFDASTVIRENGDGTVTERGFCWIPTSKLDYYWDAVTLDNAEGSQAVWGDDFSVTLTGLANSTSYRVAAYVKYQVNNYQYEGVAYSSSSTITTSSPDLPSLSSPTLNSVSFFEATLKLEFNSEGNYNITEKGICISSKISDPAIGENEGIQYIYQGDTCKFYNLSPGTRYYARAFAKCVLDEDSTTVYSSYRSFSTSDISSPTLKSLEISDITLKTMNASCGLREAGDGEIYEKGFCWVKTSSLSYYYDSPTLENATGTMVVSDGSTDTYSGMIQNLEMGTEYRVAAYMKYQVGNYQYTGVAYSGSSTVSTVSPSLPSLSEPTLNSVSFFDATLKFEFSSEGNYAITSRGICISSKIFNPAINENEQIRYISDSDTLKFDNLTYNTEYYARSFVTCSLEGDNQTVYSGYRSFTTSDITAPTLKSLETSNVTFTSIDASCGLRESNDGVITEKGFCWAKTADLDYYYTSPTLENATGTLVIPAGDTDTYSATISNLEMNTEYNIAAYMKYQVDNGQFTGVVYSGYSRLSTNNPQTISMYSPTVSDITYKSAKFTNRISSEGDYEITESGVVLSTDTRSPTIETHEFQAKYDENGTCTITGLTPYTRYYYRSYASGTLNGQSVVTYSGYDSFYSSSLSYPSISTPTVDNSSYTSADVAFSLQSEGSYIVTERGICLSSKTSEPSVTNNEFSYKLEDGETSHTFTGLTTNTTYYVRSYVVCNVDGDETTEATRYSSSTNFKTSQLAAATFNSMSTSNSTLTTLDATASIGELGDGELVEHGFIWKQGTYSNLTLDSYDGIMKVDGTDKDFSATITNLLPDKYYYVKAYARTSLQGLETVGYSDTSSQWTSDYSFNDVSAVATGNTTERVTFTFNRDDIVGLITECGVIYSKVYNESADQMTLSTVAKVSDTDSKSFIADLEKLDSNVTYYYYIYLKLEGGITYSGRRSFTTKAIPSIDDNLSPTKKD
jgi:hypothetical protein